MCDLISCSDYSSARLSHFCQTWSSPMSSFFLLAFEMTRGEGIWTRQSSKVKMPGGLPGGGDVELSNWSAHKSFRPVCHLWGCSAFLRLFELADPRLFGLLILAVYFHRRVAFWAVYRRDFSWSPELDFLKGTYAFVDPNQCRICIRDGYIKSGLCVVTAYQFSFYHYIWIYTLIYTLIFRPNYLLQKYRKYRIRCNPSNQLYRWF